MPIITNHRECDLGAKFEKRCDRYFMDSSNIISRTVLTSHSKNEASNSSNVRVRSVFNYRGTKGKRRVPII